MGTAAVPSASGVRPPPAFSGLGLGVAQCLAGMVSWPASCNRRLYSARAVYSAALYGLLVGAAALLGEGRGGCAALGVPSAAEEPELLMRTATSNLQRHVAMRPSCLA